MFTFISGTNNLVCHFLSEMLIVIGCDFKLQFLFQLFQMKPKNIILETVLSSLKLKTNCCRSNWPIVKRL
jgi:hypothetical protein